MSNPKTPFFELGQPWKYEVNPVWEWRLMSSSGPWLFPQSIFRKGGTYRARVRVRNGTMAWSHWSSPLEFVAGEPNLGDLHAGLGFNEIMYHPLDQEDVTAGDLEFLELKNVGQTTLDLGVCFSRWIEFVFPEGKTLAPGELFLVGKNQAALQIRYPGLVVDGVFDGRLANEGETITLSAGIDAPVLSVTYDDAAPWPLHADGLGLSLVLDTDSELGFRVGTIPGGSPGSDNSGLTKPADDLVLTVTRLATVCCV
ncbi:MAG: hypothetical protein CM1200mP29_01150 [Verrucomicrobiota bacterium]|nr:MAG: hypothetical protein CM1200mP29_01150 [Verrucomicrobiota bacterium]